ncbi:hypothetical protein DL240490_00358 [Mycobacterium marinum]|nr:hypothetical protein DL240490_00358 [Mycobacterium marinum]
MAERNRTDDAVVGKIVVEVVYRLSAQLAEATASIQGTLEREIVELRGDVQLLDLLHASVEGNVAAVLNAIHYDIPIERVESPTAALEYARRLAQGGRSMRWCVPTGLVTKRCWSESSMGSRKRAPIPR